MSEERRKPAIRFAGFSEEWERRKVGDLASDIYGGGTPSTSRLDFWNGSIPWIQSSDLTEHQVFGVVPKKYISKTAVKNSATKIIPENSLAVITRVGVGKLAVMPYSYATSQDFLSLSKLNADIQFSAYLLYKKLQSELSSVQGTSIKGITKEELLAKTVALPERQEQEAVGIFFRNLDTLITLHQRKYDKLVCMKKAMLEKMFPKNGSCFPEIRFAGFTDAWEQRMLGEVYSEKKERGDESLQILSVSIHHGISNGELDSDTLGKQVRRSEDKSLYKHVENGDLVLNMMRAWQGALGVAHVEGMVSPAYITATPSEGVYPYFMDYCLGREIIINQMNNLSYGVTDFRKRLYWDSFTRVACTIPSVAEQKLIYQYFEYLDHLITYQQQALEKLKTLKKAFLEKMFV